MPRYLIMHIIKIILYKKVYYYNRLTFIWRDVIPTKCTPNKTKITYTKLKSYLYLSIECVNLFV